MATPFSGKPTLETLHIQIKTLFSTEYSQFQLVSFMTKTYCSTLDFDLSSDGLMLILGCEVCDKVYKKSLCSHVPVRGISD